MGGLLSSMPYRTAQAQAGGFTKAVSPRPGFLSPAGWGLVPTCRCPGNNVEEGWASLTYPVSPQGL